STVVAPTAAYPLSLHDALPISLLGAGKALPFVVCLADQGRHGRWLTLLVQRHVDEVRRVGMRRRAGEQVFGVDHDARLHTGTPKDRKSTRLNSSHVKISYAVFC